MIHYHCHDCGEVLRSFDEEYVRNNPNGHELACEQAQLEHDACAHPETWHVETCPDCGEEIGSWPQEYLQNNPNASDMAIGGAWAEHYLSCPASEYSSTPENWSKWRKEAGAHDGETPRALIRRLIGEGMTAGEICDAITIPPDRWNVQYGELVTNWYNEIIYLVD